MKKSKAVISSILAILILVGVQVAATILTYFLAKTGIPIAACNLVHAFFFMGLVYVAIKVLTEKYLKLDLEEIGIADVQVSPKWFIVSVLLPVIVLLSFLVFPGDIHLTDLSNFELWDSITEGIFIMGLAAGFTEEIVFRGLIMNVFEKSAGRWLGFIIPSILYGIMQVFGTNFSLAASLQVLFAGMISGFMFCLIAYEESSIWNSAVVHVIWNMVVFGGIFAIGESTNFKAKYTYVIEIKNQLLTGGEYGIAASVIAMVAFIVVSIIAYKGIQKTHYMYKGN